MENRTLRESLTSEDQRKVFAAFPTVRNSVMGELLHNFGNNYTKKVSIEEFMQDFFDSVKFRDGKGILAKLDDYGKFNELDKAWNRTGVNREMVNQVMNETISLKRFANSDNFLEQNLSKNELGTQMLPIIKKKFIEKIDHYLTSTAGIHQKTKEDREEIKLRYQDTKVQMSLPEFLADTNVIFGDRYVSDEEREQRPENPQFTSHLELSPILLDIYPKISISTKEILQELKEKGVITQQQENELFQKKSDAETTRGNLEKCIDCILTGDKEKSVEFLKEKITLDNQFQDLLQTPVPQMDDVHFLLERKGRSNPMDPRVFPPSAEAFKESVEAFREVLLLSPTDDDNFRIALKKLNATNASKFKTKAEAQAAFDKMIAEFNIANTTTFTTIDEIIGAPHAQINKYIIHDAKKEEVLAPQNNEERNTVIKQSLRNKTNRLLSQLPKDDKEYQQRAGNYLKTMELYTQRLLDPNNTEITLLSPVSGVQLTIPVKKSFGDAVKKPSGTHRRERTDNDILDMKFDLSDIPDEVHQALTAMDSAFLKTKFFPVRAKNGEQAISRDYLVEVDGKTGHLSENLEGMAENDITPEVQTLITKHGRDKLTYLIDEQGKVVEAYTKKDLKQNKEVQVKKRDLHLEGDDLQKFVSALLLSQLGTPDGNTKNEGAVHDALNQIDEQVAQRNDPNTPPLSTEEREAESEDFRKRFWGLDGAFKSGETYNSNISDEQMGLKKWTRLWIKTWWESELPPADKASDQNQWIQLKILNPDAEGGKSVEVEMTGGELKLGGLEKAKKTFPKTKKAWTKFIEDLGGTMYKLEEKKDLEQTSESFANSGINANDFGDLTSRVRFEWNDILFNDGENAGKKAEYFTTSENYLSRQDKNYEGEDVTVENPQFITYKVERDGDKFKVTSNYLTEDDKEKDKKGNPKVVQGEYTQEMDYNNLLLFLTTKQLRPLPEKVANEHKKAQEEQVKAALPKKTRRRFSINNLLHAGKNIYSTRETKRKEYGKQQDEDLMDRAVDQGIYDFAGGIMGFFGWTGGAEGAARANIEYWGNRMNRTYDKVKRWKELLAKDGDRGKALSKKGYLPQILKGDSVADFLKKKGKPGAKISERERYFLTAVLLTQIEKGKSPYRNMPEIQRNGSWVKMLLGDEHQQNFLRQREKKREEMDSEGGGWSRTKQITKDMAQAEMLYLINVMDDRAVGNDAMFGNLPKHAFPDGDSTLFKRRLGPQLAKDIEEGIRKTYVTENFNSEWQKVSSQRNFSHCYKEFRRFAFSWRYGQAMPYLKQMGCMAKSSSQISQWKCALLIGLTSGIFRHCIFPEVQDAIEQMGRSLGFPPAMHVCTPPEHPQKIAQLLDYCTDNKFSKSTGEWGTGRKWSTFDNKPDSKEEPKKKGMYAKYFEDFEKFWHNHGDEIGNKIKELPMIDVNTITDKNQAKAVKYYQDATFDTTVMNIDTDVGSNDSIYPDNPLGQSQSSMKGTLLKFSNGKYDARDVDTEQAMQLFRERTLEDITKYKGKKKGMKALTKKILGNRSIALGFNDTTKEKTVRMLKCVVDMVEKGKGAHVAPSGVTDNGNVIPKSQIDTILDYTIVGRFFENASSPPKEIIDALRGFKDGIYDAIQHWRIDDDFIEESFPGFGKYFTDNKKYHYMDRKYVHYMNQGDSKQRGNTRTQYQMLQSSLLNHEMEAIDKRIKGGTLGYDLYKPPEETVKVDIKKLQEELNRLAALNPIGQTTGQGGTPPPPPPPPPQTNPEEEQAEDDDDDLPT